MTLQQLKYMIIVAERGSITEAAKELYISQPSLSGAIKEVEKESGITIFSRCRAGVALTKEGMEFLGYARQVVQQMELLESKYIDKKPAKQRFCVAIICFILTYYKKSLTFRITESIMAYRCKGGIAYGQNGASEVGYH